MYQAPSLATWIVGPERHIYVSPTTDRIPPIPLVFKEYPHHNHSFHLSPQWGLASHPYLPLVPSQPRFDGPIFSCLSYTRRTIPVEGFAGGYRLNQRVKNQWSDLEHKLSYVISCLSNNCFVPFHFQYPSAPQSYGYTRVASTRDLVKRNAMRSRNAFLVLVATCSYLLIQRIKINNIDQDPVRAQTLRILKEMVLVPHPAWIDALNNSFVANFSANVPRVGAFVHWDKYPFAECMYKYQVLGVPYWMFWGAGTVQTAIGPDYRPYQPGTTHIRNAVVISHNKKLASSEGTSWGSFTPAHVDSWQSSGDGSTGGSSERTEGLGPVTWGTVGLLEGGDSSHQEFNWGGGWEPVGLEGDATSSPTPPPPNPEAAQYPAPNQGTHQLRGETWQQFFARRAEANRRCEEDESASRRTSRLDRERHAALHAIPSVRNRVTVFEWVEYDGFYMRQHVTHDNVASTWGSYSNTTRVYDGFSNQWDLCQPLDPSAGADDDQVDDEDEPGVRVPEAPPRYADVPPPPPNHFLADLTTFYGADIPTTTINAREALHVTMHYQFGFLYDVSYSDSDKRYLPEVATWKQKIDWTATRKLIGDAMAESFVFQDRTPIYIRDLIACLATYKHEDLRYIPADLWDISPNSERNLKFRMNPRIRVMSKKIGDSYYYFIVPVSVAPIDKVLWALVTQDSSTAAMCLRRAWGPSLRSIARELLQLGTAFSTFMNFGCEPVPRPPSYYSPGHRRAGYRGDKWDYMVYERQLEEFMRTPHSRAALLAGGIVWRLAMFAISQDIDVLSD
ncbi:hypothetical protein BJ138DRAFT_1107493, partial [Hygrophoropsis aurantiaca]